MPTHHPPCSCVTFARSPPPPTGHEALVGPLARRAPTPKPLGLERPRIAEAAAVSVISTREVRLPWRPPAGQSDIAGYHVERAVVEVFSEDEVVRLKKDTPPLAEPSVGAVKQI